MSKISHFNIVCEEIKELSSYKVAKSHKFQTNKYYVSSLNKPISKFPIYYETK